MVPLTIVATDIVGNYKCGWCATIAVVLLGSLIQKPWLCIKICTLTIFQNHAYYVLCIVVGADKYSVFCGCGILSLTVNQIELSSTGFVSLIYIWMLCILTTSYFLASHLCYVSLHNQSCSFVFLIVPSMLQPCSLDGILC